jgi:hypothetical protein
MKKLTVVFLTTVIAALLAASAVFVAQEVPQFAPPQKEHEWLKQFVGEWESEGEAIMEPGQPPLKSKGSSSARMLGGYWMVADVKGSFAEMSFSAVLTLGYDPQQKKYVGTWVDSMINHLWKYEGSVDEAGKILTLLAEGPNPSLGGKMSKFKDVFEFKSKDHKVLTSSMQGEDGQWASFLTINYRRKK